MIYAMVGRIVVWAGAAVAVGYGLVGAYIVVRLYIVYY